MDKKRGKSGVNKIIGKIYGSELPNVGVSTTLFTLKILGEDFMSTDIKEELYKKINKKKIEKEKK